MSIVYLSDLWNFITSSTLSIMVMATAKALANEKKKCIGHVQKRVSTALRKLCGRERKRQVNRDGTVVKLQNYYGTAIRSNVGNLTGMKNPQKSLRR